MHGKELPLREKQKLATRRHIQEVAKALIADLGYEKTTMRALAREAGVGLGTISLHFKDKKSLLLASFHEEIGGVAERAIESAPLDQHIREQFLHIVLEMYKYYAANTKYLRPMVKEVLFADGEWGQILDAQIFKYIGLLRVVLDSAKGRGELRSNVDSMAMAQNIWAAYLYVLLGGLKQETFVADAQLARFEPLLDVIITDATA